MLQFCAEPRNQAVRGVQCERAAVWRVYLVMWQCGCRQRLHGLVLQPSGGTQAVRRT
jgi:hypothetical protein